MRCLRAKNILMRIGGNGFLHLVLLRLTMLCQTLFTCMNLMCCDVSLQPAIKSIQRRSQSSATRLRPCPHGDQHLQLEQRTFCRHGQAQTSLTTETLRYRYLGNCCLLDFLRTPRSTCLVYPKYHAKSTRLPNIARHDGSLDAAAKSEP